MNPYHNDTEATIQQIKTLADKTGRFDEAAEHFKDIYEAHLEFLEELEEVREEQKIAEQEERESLEYRRGEWDAMKENEATGN